MQRLALLVLILANLGSNARGDAIDNRLLDEGRQLYRTTVRADGSAIRALVQHDVPLPPGLSACSNCHRRSGFGVSEGGSRSLNLTAPALFNATDKPPIRPAYNDRTLVRAIVAGIAADGRELHPTMPRYELNRDDANALIAYLSTLAAEPPDGISDDELTIATVVSDTAPAAEKEAVIRVLRTYVELRNNESRRDSERAAASNRHSYGRVRQRAFRRWNLHVWDVSGDPSTWPEQLDAWYVKHRPFVILSGAAGADWLPIHRFCEAREVPCLLPVNGGPAAADDDFYPLYYSTGPVLEAGVTARHLQKSVNDRSAEILIVHRDAAVGDGALEALSDRLAAAGFDNVDTVIAKKPLSTQKWRRLLRAKSPQVLVAWLSEDSVGNLFSADFDAERIPRFVYTTAAYTSWAEAAELSDHRLRHVYPYSVAPRGLAQFPREHFWLKQHALGELDSVAAAKALYACRVLGMGLADIQSNFSREYLLETLEHALDGTQMTSLFPRTSLGPNQRLLSRGAYVLTADELREGTAANLQWLQP